MIKINEPRLILMHAKEKTDGTGKQKGWLQLSFLDEKWPWIVQKEAVFISLYQNTEDITVVITVIITISIFILFSPALLWSTWSLFAADSVGGNVLSTLSDIEISGIMTVRPGGSITATSLHQFFKQKKGLCL